LMVTQDSCQFVTDCLEFPVVSVEELDVNQIEIYPNPVSDILEVRGPKNGQRVLIYSLLGKQISEISSNSGTTKIDLSELASGIFLLRVSDGDHVSTFRIVKE
ncbi:T9SS type A sorting domain-containing protein, partial [Halocola ammonii]